jgi:phosphoribosyl 1,2-cyclic phosphate phosphodiesterase
VTVHFLGTGASPAMPIPFCGCGPCRTARAVGGRNLRRRSSLLVDGALLVDLGPDVATASFDQGVGLESVRWCLQTHAHGDHFDPEFLMSRHPEWRTAPAPLSLFASRGTLDAMDSAVSQRCDYGSILDVAAQCALQLGIAEASAFTPIAVGNYTVIPYPANHGSDQGALLYSIDDGQHGLFYGTDTGVITDAVWRDVTTRGAQYDLVVLDHTYGIGCRGGRDHLCAEEVANLTADLRATGILRREGLVLATHLSHEGMLEHDRLQEYASERGYQIAHDGMTVSLGSS